MEALAKQFSLVVTDHPDDSPETSAREPLASAGTENGCPSVAPLAFWQKWYEAFKQVLPIYFATHLAVFLINSLSFLFLFSRPYHLSGKPYQQVQTPLSLHSGASGTSGPMILPII